MRAGRTGALTGPACDGGPFKGVRAAISCSAGAGDAAPAAAGPARRSALSVRGTCAPASPRRRRRPTRRPRGPSRSWRRTLARRARRPPRSALRSALEGRRMGRSAHADRRSSSPRRLSARTDRDDGAPVERLAGRADGGVDHPPPLRQRDAGAVDVAVAVEGEALARGLHALEADNGLGGERPADFVARPLGQPSAGRVERDGPAAPSRPTISRSLGRCRGDRLSGQ